jgi:predicted transposase/invertase (TIGR01784 family)
MTYKYLTQLPKPKFMEMLEEDAKAAGLAEGKAEGIERGIEQGIERGIRAKALEDAQKMLNRNCEWDFITEITGICPEDLEAK